MQVLQLCLQHMMPIIAIFKTSAVAETNLL